jgi:hypothetical protein
MCHDLPTAADTNSTARQGVTMLQQRLERVVQRNKVTGRLFKAQIKSSEQIEWRDDEASVPVKVTTYNLWREMPLLTILFLVETTTRSIYWTPALAHHPAPGRASLSIKFDKGSNIRGDIDPLTSYLLSWFSVRSFDTVLQEVPQFYQIFSDLNSDIDHYDDPLALLSQN